MELKDRQNELLHSRQVFDVELTTRCNKNCYICPREKLNRIANDMTVETFNILKEWLPNDCDVFFAGFGEPLLHKNLNSFITQLTQKGIRVSIMTNATLLNKEIINRLFDAGLTKLQVSIIRKEEWLIDKILSFIDNKYQKNQEKKLQFNLLYDKTNTIMDTYLSLLNERNYYVVKKQVHSRGGYYLKSKQVVNSCGTFFIISYINLEGDIHICSNDINGENLLGNIRNSTFIDIQNKKRNFLGNVEISLLCRACTDEYRFIHLNKNL